MSLSRHRAKDKAKANAEGEPPREKNKMSLLNQVLRGAAEVSMVKLVLQSTAEVLHCMVA